MSLADGWKEVEQEVKRQLSYILNGAQLAALFVEGMVVITDWQRQQVKRLFPGQR